MPSNQEDKNTIKEIILLANRAIANYNEGIEKLEESVFYPLFQKIIDNPYLAEDDDRSYYNSVFESVKSFELLTGESYISFEKSVKDQQTLFGKPYSDTLYVNIVSINVSRRFKELIDKNNVLILMSGTIHSEKVLKDIFGLEKFRIIEAETQSPGKVSIVRTGLEKNCKYENLALSQESREKYLRALSACIGNATHPTLVHVSSFKDLPSDYEKKKFNLPNLTSREELAEQQGAASVESFKSKKVNVLFTTKCSRGIDFPGEQCNSVVLTKYPYPNIQGLFWQILKKEHPDKFMEFYFDKARRDLIQKIARGIRFKGDHVFLLSPDSRVLDAKIN